MRFTLLPENIVAAAAVRTSIEVITEQEMHRIQMRKFESIDLSTFILLCQKLLDLPNAE
jgi:hypothetical protein